MTHPSRAFPQRPLGAVGLLPPVAPARRCARCQQPLSEGQPHALLGALLVCPACYRAAVARLQEAAQQFAAFCSRGEP